MSSNNQMLIEFGTTKYIIEANAVDNEYSEWGSLAFKSVEFDHHRIENYSVERWNMDVDDADGEWDGYEIYMSLQEAVDAATGHSACQRQAQADIALDMMVKGLVQYMVDNVKLHGMTVEVFDHTDIICSQGLKPTMYVAYECQDGKIVTHMACLEHEPMDPDGNPCRYFGQVSLGHGCYDCETRKEASENMWSRFKR